MGKVGNAAIEARQRARERRLAMEKGRQERDDRIGSATTAVILVAADIADARAAAAAALAVYPAAGAAADKVDVHSVAEQEQRIGAAVRGAARRETVGRSSRRPHRTDHR